MRLVDGFVLDSISRSPLSLTHRDRYNRREQTGGDFGLPGHCRRRPWVQGGPVCIPDTAGGRPLPPLVSPPQSYCIRPIPPRPDKSPCIHSSPSQTAAFSSTKLGHPAPMFLRRMTCWRVRNPRESKAPCPSHWPARGRRLSHPRGVAVLRCLFQAASADSVPCIGPTTPKSAPIRPILPTLN